MKTPAGLFQFAFILMFTQFFPTKVNGQTGYEYSVAKLNSSMAIDADWNKSQWMGVDSIKIDNRLGSLPKYTPVTNVKMLFDDENIYVIFKVQDKYVKCTRTEINSDVYNDACVEFFFSPVLAKPEEYFNFEINSGGVAMLR